MTQAVNKEAPATLLEGLRAEQALVQSDTWENEPELMSLLEEALILYWECFSRLQEHEMVDDVEKALVYLGAAAFHSLQSCFTLMELGYYRQGIVGIRTLMNEYLLCRTFVNDPQSATRYLENSDWPAVRELVADLLPELQSCDPALRQYVDLLAGAAQEGLSWSAYVAAQKLVRSKKLCKELKEKLDPLYAELRKEYMPGMGELLGKLRNTLLSPKKTLGYRCDLELLHRHAHSAWVAIRAEVVATDELGGQWMTPRYERGRCRYCGYRVGLWSAAVLQVLTQHFQRLDGDAAWRARLKTFENDLLVWGQQAQSELRGVTP